MRIILVAATLVSSAMASTLVVKGPLTEKTAYHLLEAFVQDSGANLDAVPYKGYNVTLGYVKDVAPQDTDYMSIVINKWLQDHADQIRGMNFRVDRAESDSKKLMITGEHITNDFYKLRYSLQSAVSSATPPSGRRYALALNHKGIFVPSIYVGDIEGKTAKQVVRTINRRIEQSHIIHKDHYFEIDVNNLRLYQLS